MRARLAAALYLALVVGCAPTTPTPSVDETAIATGVPSSDAPPAATPGPGSVPLARVSAATVIVDRLPVRVDASATADSPGDLVRGDVAVLMVFGPLEFNGASWFYAQKVPNAEPGTVPALPVVLADPAEEFPLVGWIAASDASGETVAPLPPRCPTTPDFVNVSAMLDGERLACFGADPITLDGSFGCLDCGSDGSGVFEPPWLAGPSAGPLGDPTNSGRPSIALHFPPALEAPEAESLVRVTGHFDDPAAGTCEITFGDTPVAPEMAVQLCRVRFVVDSFKPLSVEEVPPAD